MPRLGKNVLTQYLRTCCDRQLFLSLHEPQELDREGLPVPLEARPQVQILRDEGKAWEQAKCEDLVKAFPNNVLGNRAVDGKFNKARLAAFMSRAPHAPTFMLQVEFRVRKETLLAGLGMTDDEVAEIPPLSSFIPDIILVRERNSSDEEVLPSGQRRPLSCRDTRFALQISDIKHTGEANSSYSSEVALYSFALSSWLDRNNLNDRYFVTTLASLWTRANSVSSLIRLLAENPTASLDERLSAYQADLEEVVYSVFFQSIKKFFTNDLRRVLRSPFPDLEWHVDGRCSGCDYLGHRDWLSREDRQILDQNPCHYCVPLAENTAHLSRIPTLTRGGRRTLESNDFRTVPMLGQCSAEDQVFEQHNGLRGDRDNLPERANAITNQTITINPTASTADMPKWQDMSIFTTVNFDPRSGLLTSIGYSGLYRQRRPFGDATAPTRNSWRSQASTLMRPTSEEERAVIMAFLTNIGAMFEYAKANQLDERKNQTRTQLFFWDERQFVELTRAIGRHLIPILSDKSNRAISGLAWLFPPELLLEDSKIVTANPITFVKAIIKKVARLPITHAITLFNVSDVYCDDDFQPIRSPGSLMRDPFSDMIPRERIYEIWSEEPLIRIGKTQKSRSQCISDFDSVVRRQVEALRQVAWKLRADLSQNLITEARYIDPTFPFNFQRLPDDSRLWLGWIKLEVATQRIDKRRIYCSNPIELEAQYKILRFSGLQALVGRKATFSTRAGSKDCKIRDGQGFLSVSNDDIPGFCSMRVMDVVPRSDWENIPNQYQNKKVQLNKVLGATLASFNRDNDTAVVVFESYWDELRDFIINNGYVDLSGNCSLVDGMGVDESEKIRKCLVGIGNPNIARPHPHTLSAIGQGRATAGTDLVTPPAEVLWDGGRMAETASGIPETDLSTILEDLVERGLRLDDSQSPAIREALRRRLAVIWGPPGTGKTTTAAALVLARVVWAYQNGETLRILITGPTYNAWENLLKQTISSLKFRNDIPINLFRVYPEHRGGRGELPDEVPDNVNIREAVTVDYDANFQALKSALEKPRGIVLVGAVANQCYRIGMVGADTVLNQYFDFEVIDEGSQLDLCRSLYPLCLLEANAQLMVFGDDLQMPPIMSTEPPADAAWLVGSIQAYLVQRFGLARQMLHVNYRSAARFTDFAKSIGYGPQLRSHSPNLALNPFGDLSAEPDKWNGDLLFGSYIDTILRPETRLVAVTYEDGRNGQANPFEADLVCAVTQSLFKQVGKGLIGLRDEHGQEVLPTEEPADSEYFWTKGLGIVTPHRAQRAAVVRKMKRIFPSHTPDLIDQAVDTVERFQGGERQAIIVAFGVGDPDLITEEEEFLLQLERTNVAISRARAKCVLMISEELAYHLPQDKRIIKTSRAVKGFIADFCTNSTSTHVSYGDGRTREIAIRFSN